jgi:hypothetical protein
VAESSEEDDLVPARSPTISAGDYVHGSDEEEAVLAQTKAVSEAEARARFRREEADAVIFEFRFSVPFYGFYFTPLRNSIELTFSVH